MLQLLFQTSEFTYILQVVDFLILDSSQNAEEFQFTLLQQILMFILEAV